MIRLPTDLETLCSDGGTLVVPSRQRAHAVRLAHAAAQLQSGRRVWMSADVLTLEAWLTREIEEQAGDAQLPRLLATAEEWYLWRQCTAAATSDLDLVNRAALADALRHASVLAAEYRIDVKQFQAPAGSETELLQRVLTAVEAKCRGLRAAPLAALAWRLAPPGGARPVRFSGFLSRSPRLADIAARRVPLGYQPSAAAASAAAIESLTQPLVILPADEIAELEHIAQWCHSRLQCDPSARLLVVLPGSAGNRERLATLIQQAVDPRAWLAEACEVGEPRASLVVIEGGRPLAQLPAVAHALATLQWLAGNPGEFAAVSEWLRAPFWSLPEPQARARLDVWLREQVGTELDLQVLAAALQAVPDFHATAAAQVGDQLTRGLQALGQGPVSTRDWSLRFRDALGVFGWPGARTADSRDFQTMMRFHELLDEFGQLAATAGPITCHTAVRLFCELAAGTAFQPADDDGAVTISSALADPVVRYDGIWVAGLHSDALPQAVKPDPFLPLAAQLAAALPAASAAARHAEARMLLTAWRAATSHLVLSAPARSGDLELLASPLLAQWLGAAADGSRSDGPRQLDLNFQSVATPHVQVPPPARSVWLPIRMHRAGLLESLDDVLGIPWPAPRTLPGGSRSLELQNLCPFRAYAELRLGSAELGAPEPGIPADERGRLLHLALQLFWDQVRDHHTLTGLGETQLQSLIGTCVGEAATRIAGDARRAQSRALDRECRRAGRLIAQLCALEKERAPFRVAATELNRELRVAGARLQLRIDRLDELHDGGRAILDYKSGQRTAGDWYGERPSHPQLLAYLAALDEDVVAMATVNLTAREVRFDGIASAAQRLPQVRAVKGPDGTTSEAAWLLRRSEWLRRVAELAAGFVSGRATVDPRPGACDYCQVKSICRIAERGLQEHDQDPAIDIHE